MKGSVKVASKQIIIMSDVFVAQTKQPSKYTIMELLICLSSLTKLKSCGYVCCLHFSPSATECSREMSLNAVNTGRFLVNLRYSRAVNEKYGIQSKISSKSATNCE